MEQVRRVALFGHSYVKRLQFQSFSYGKRFNQVKLFGLGGATAESLLLSNVYIELLLFKPHVVYLHIGGNDINEDCSVQVIVENIKKIVWDLESNGIKVIVNEIEPRLRPRYCSAERYQKIRNVINKYLRRTFKGDPVVKHCNLDYEDFRIDGVHLNQLGEVKLIKCIEQALKDHIDYNDMIEY